MRLAIHFRTPLYTMDQCWPEDEYRMWLAFSQVEALPDAHWDAAMVAHTIARTMGGYKGKMDAFLPQVGERKPLTHKQLMARLVLGLGAKRKQEVGDGEE